MSEVHFTGTGIRQLCHISAPDDAPVTASHAQSVSLCHQPEQHREVAFELAPPQAGGERTEQPLEQAWTSLLSMQAAPANSEIAAVGRQQVAIVAKLVATDLVSSHDFWLQG